MIKEGDGDDDLNQALLDSIPKAIMQVAEDGDSNAKAQPGKHYHYYIDSARKG